MTDVNALESLANGIGLTFAAWFIGGGIVDYLAASKELKKKGPVLGYQEALSSLEDSKRKSWMNRNVLYLGSRLAYMKYLKDSKHSSRQRA